MYRGKIKCNLRDAIDLALFRFVSTHVTQKKFPAPPNCQEGAKAEVHLFAADDLVELGNRETITSDEVITGMASLGFEPVTHPVMLAPGNEYRRLERNTFVVALGSVLENRVILLGKDGLDLFLVPESYTKKWPVKRYRFAGRRIRK